MSSPVGLRASLLRRRVSDDRESTDGPSGKAPATSFRRAGNALFRDDGERRSPCASSRSRTWDAASDSAAFALRNKRAAAFESGTLALACASVASISAIAFCMRASSSTVPGRISFSVSIGSSDGEVQGTSRQVLTAVLPHLDHLVVVRRADHAQVGNIVIVLPRRAGDAR